MVAASPPVEHAVLCGECGAPMRLRSSRHGPFYGCSRFPTCQGTHGAHANGAPLGTPANVATKAARIRAHVAFDPLWNTGVRSRSAAYRWMQEALGLTPAEAHIGQFTVAQCDRLIAACAAGAPIPETPIGTLRLTLVTALAARFGRGKAGKRAGRVWMAETLGRAGEAHVDKLDADACRALLRELDGT